MSDQNETTIEYFKNLIRRERYEGEEKRSRDPLSALKWLPLVVVAITAAVGYGKLQSDVTHMEKAIEEIKETNKAQWQQMRDNR